MPVRTKAHFQSHRGFLGTPVEWKVFLFIEALTQAGMSRVGACEQAAWKFYRTAKVPPYAEVIETHPTYPTSLEGQMYARRAYEKQGAHILNRQAAIHGAIEGVYPAFRPLLREPEKFP